MAFSLGMELECIYIPESVFVFLKLRFFIVLMFYFVSGSRTLRS